MTATDRQIKNIVAKEGDTDELIERVSLRDYLAWPDMSGSSLLQQSPKHVRHHYETHAKSTDFMRKGSAEDVLLFDYLIPARQEGRSVSDAVEEFDAAWPVWEGTRRGKTWDSFYEEHGEHYLKRTKDKDEREEIVGMLDAIVNDPVAAPYWESGTAQVSYRVTESGLRFKGRVDWLGDCIVDLKTTARIAPTRIGYTIRDLGYTKKMAMYRRWHRKLTGVWLPCVLIFVESSAPHDVAVVPIPDVVLSLAEEKMEDNIKALVQSIKSDVWLGVAEGQELALDWPIVEPEPEFADAEG